MNTQTFKQTLCWRCQNATGHCDWSKNFKPVKGWTAKETRIYDKVQSFIVISCPEFEEDKKKEETKENVAVVKPPHRVHKERCSREIIIKAKDGLLYKGFYIFQSELYKIIDDKGNVKKLSPKQIISWREIKYSDRV